MIDRHPDPVSLNRFGRGKLRGAESRAVVRHLLNGCAVCRRVTRRFLPPALAGRPRPVEESGAVLSSDYSAAFERARRAVVLQQTALADEQCAASGLRSELASHPHDRQRILIANSARFQSWSLCEVLLDEAREQGFREPARALELARLGVDVAERLDGERYGEERVNDLAARAWATLANAQRVRSDFRSADDGFARARALLRQGTGDPLEKARLLLLEASLRSDQRRFVEAFRLLDRVIRLADRYGDRHLCGKALITKGLFYGYAGRLEAALQALEAGNARIDPAVEPRLVLAGRHNLILHLADSGRHEEALQLLERTRPLYCSSATAWGSCGSSGSRADGPGAGAGGQGRGALQPGAGGVRPARDRLRRGARLPRPRRDLRAAGTSRRDATAGGRDAADLPFPRRPPRGHGSAAWSSRRRRRWSASPSVSCASSSITSGGAGRAPASSSASAPDALPPSFQPSAPADRAALAFETMHAPCL